jgi:simple sugar transport system permease protein
MFIYRLHFGSPLMPPTVAPFRQIPLPFLSKIPVIGPSLFSQYSLVYIVWVLVPVVSVFLHRTRWGLIVRTVGSNPFSADTAGINVNLTRTVCVAAGGALMGVGGAFLTLAHQNMFLIDVIGGRGWIAIAMTIFGNWDPLRGVLGALIFGFLDGLQLRLQGVGLNIPFHIFLMVPYVVTIFALVAVSRKATVPAGLLKPYRREEKGG